MALSSRLRRLQEELAAYQASQRPLGAFVDPDLADQAMRVRGRREASLQGKVGGAGAQVLRRLGTIEAGHEQFPGRRPGGTGLTGLDRTDKEGYLRLLGEQREGADLEAALSGRPAPTVQVEPSASRAFTVRGVRRIGTLGAGGRAQEAAPSPSASETGGERDLRARRDLAETRRLEELAKQEEAVRRQEEQAARSPLEREQDFASVKQFRGRKGVREEPERGLPSDQEGPPTVRGVRRFGTTAEPVEPPGDPEQEMLERLTSGGTEIPSNVAQSLISRGTQREQLEGRKAIRDANDRMRRDLAEAGNNVQLQRLAVARWQAEMQAAGLSAGLEINAQRFGQEGGFMGFGQDTAPNIQSALDEFGNLRREGPGGGGGDEEEDLSQLSDEELQRILRGR